MDKLFQLPLTFLVLFYSLKIVPAFSSGCIFWPDDISQEPAVGFDLTLSYGTSVALFPNGTFSNLAIVHGNDDYKIWMSRALESTIHFPPPWYHQSWGAILCPKVEIEDKKTVWSYFKGYTQLKTTERLDLLLDDITPLADLLGQLKEETETRIGYSLAQVAASYPSFFAEEHKRRLQNALQQVSLHENGCHGNGRSSVAALVAHRQAEFNLGESTRQLDCIHGPFGIENIIHIENTEHTLSLTAFEFYAGQRSSYAKENFRSPTYLNKTQVSAARNKEDSHSSEGNTRATARIDFWTTARACLEEYFDAQYFSKIDTVYRLILTGTQSRDPDLLRTLRSTRGVKELVPQSYPVALFIQRDPEKISQKSRERSDRLQGIHVHDSYQAEIMYEGGDWGMYGVNLLKSARHEIQNFNTAIDPIYAAARGAALYSLESRLFPCTTECNFIYCEDRQSLAFGDNFVAERHRRDNLTDLIEEEFYWKRYHD